jgi:hypothetical protein
LLPSGGNGLRLLPSTVGAGRVCLERIVDNRHIPYINAIIAADIKGKAKFTMLCLIDSMDFDTRETYIGQTALAKKMGSSYDAAKDGIDLCQELKLIEFVGFHPIHPGSVKATNTYRILIQPLGGTVRDLPTVEDSTVGKKPTVGKSPGNHIQNGGGVDGRGGGKGSNAVEEPHTYTHTNASTQSKAADDTETDQPLKTKKFSDEEIRTLVSVFCWAAELDTSTDSPVDEGCRTIPY